MIKRLLLAILFCTMLFFPVSCKRNEDAGVKKGTNQTAQKGTSRIQARIKETDLVILNRQNNYTDQLEKGYFSRSATSGPGTGVFIGKGFEFAKGPCSNIDGRWLQIHQWRSETLGCSGKLFSSDWCARLRADHSVQYSIHFLSWTIGPGSPAQKCMGECEKNNNQTAYVRTRFQP